MDKGVNPQGTTVQIQMFPFPIFILSRSKFVEPFRSLKFSNTVLGSLGVSRCSFQRNSVKCEENKRLLGLFQPVLSQEGIVQRNIRKMLLICFSLGNLKRRPHGKLKLANSCWQTRVDVCERHKHSLQVRWQPVGDKQNLPLFSPTFSSAFLCS